MPTPRSIAVSRLFSLPLCLIAVLTCAAAALHAQVKFERISWDQGISQSQINCITQDNRRFIWIGTNNGLNLYNGYEFREFNHDPKDPASLSNSRVWSVYETRDSVLYIATWGGGLNRLDRGSGHFTAYRHEAGNERSISSDDVRTICEDRSGNLWVGTWGGGVCRLDRSTGEFTRFQLADSTTAVTEDNVWVVYEDVDGDILVGTSGNGLMRFNSDVNAFEPVMLIEGADAIEHFNDVSAIYAAGDSLWVGTWGAGLFVLDRVSGNSRRFIHRPEKPNSLSNDYVRSIVNDAEGNLWVGAWGGGVSILNRGASEFRLYTNDPEERQSLSDDLVSSICRGASDIMWVGTWGGLNVYDKLKQKFAHFRARGTGQVGINRNEVHAIVQADKTTLWVGAWSGLNRFKLQRGEWVYNGSVSFENSNLSAYDTDIRAIRKRADGKLWVGSVGGGLMIFDPSTNNFTQFKHKPEDSSSISHNDVRAIIERPDGQLWVGTSGGGFNLFNPKTGTFRRFLNKQGNNNSLVNNFVSAMVVDSAGRLWVGTLDGGVSLFQPQTEQFVNFRQEPDNPRGLSSNSINHMFVDADGALWIGTDRGGVNCLRNAGSVAGAAAQFERYTVADGLVNNRVYAICADSSGAYWISADQGLSRLTYDAAADSAGPHAHFRSFDINDGLQGHEFNEGACYVSADGEVFFGGPNGFNAFRPDRIVDNPWIPPVELTNFTVFGEPYLQGADPAEIDEVELNYDQNFFSFEFVALNYTNSQKNRYEFMLEGFDRDWVQAGTRRYTNYTNLDGGSYTFHVRGSNNDGAWNNKGASLRVRVIPPFWETLWFKVSAAAAAIAIIALIFTLRMRGLKQQKLMLEREVKSQTAEIRAQHDQLAAAHAEVEEQRDSLKSANTRLESALTDLRMTQDQLVHAEKMASLGELTAGIAHEIQNPLNFVNNFADISSELCDDLDEQLQSAKLADEADRVELEQVLKDMRGNMERIKQHGSRATNIVSGMLEHSRGHSSAQALTDVNPLVNQAVNLAVHGLRAQDPDFNCEIVMNLASDLPQVNMSSADIQRVLINLVNNACYAAVQRARQPGSTTEPRVHVSSAQKDGMLEIRVRDNGAGIAHEIREKIFTPFFTTKPSGKGTGLGLSIAFDVVTNGHGGVLDLESKHGEFTEFRVRLPLQRRS